MKKGFQKITPSVSTSSESSFLTPKPKKKMFRWKLILGILGIPLVLIGILAVLIGLPAKSVYDELRATEGVAREAYQAAKKQDLEEAKVKFQALETQLKKVQEKEASLSWLRSIPWVGGYESDLHHALSGGISSVQAVSVTIDTLLPYADLLGLKGKSTFVSGSAEERIRTAVATLDKIVPNVDKIAEKISAAETSFEKIDPDRYPEKIKSYEVAPRIRAGKQLFSETAALFVQAQPLLKRVPDLMGNKEAKRYLVLFQNDKELRATGGFITAYGLFKIDKGKLQVEQSEDIYKLDAAKKKTYPAPAPLLKYHKNVFTLELRDNNLSPDFSVSMSDFEKMLKDSVPGFPSYDGIIALDTHVLVSTIKILGEFNIYGRTFSAEPDKRCDGCPKAIYELEDYATKPVAYVREERKDIIGVLLLQIMQKALGVSPSQYWGQLSQMFLDEAKQKHVLFYFRDPEAQKGIEALGYGGRIIEYPGDYLHISNSNMAGAKSDLFIKHAVKQDIEMADDGSIQKTITVTYKNPSPPSNCNLEAGQLCLNGIWRNWVRVYVPKGSKLMKFTGSEKDTVSYDELGKTVFEGFMTLKPQATSQISLTYTLPKSVPSGKEYSMLIQKQPGTDGYEYSVSAYGKLKEQFLLQTDKEIRIKL